MKQSDADKIDRVLVCFSDDTGVEKEETESQAEDLENELIITEPFDPTLIRVETKPMTMDLLVSRIREEELDLMPAFQRRAGIWNDVTQSRLIESMLIRIPLPAFYMDGSDENKWLVIDGLQRLTTIKRFVIDNELRLSGLEFLDKIKGKIFAELPRNLQRRINETQVTVYLIEKGTPPEVKFNIFKRINTGGLPLTPQEIRHALNQGAATELLGRLSKSPEFMRAIDFSIKDKRMADQECVLRFLAFTITPYYNYLTKDFDAFLNQAMAALNKSSDRELESLEEQFLRSMAAARVLFGKYAFRKHIGQFRLRYPINKALFETWSVSLNHLTDEQISTLRQRKRDLAKGFMHLMSDRKFEDSISQGTGDTSKVKYRFQKIAELIKEVLNDQIAADS